MAVVFVHGVLPAAQSDQRPHAGVFPASVRVDLADPRVDGEWTGDGSGDLAEDGGVTAITTVRTGDEEAKVYHQAVYILRLVGRHRSEYRDTCGGRMLMKENEISRLWTYGERTCCAKRGKCSSTQCTTIDL